MPPKSNQEMRKQSISPNLHFYPNLRLMATCIPVCSGKENTQNRPKNQSEECIHEKFTLYTCMFWRQKSLLGKSANCPSQEKTKENIKVLYVFFPDTFIPTYQGACFVFQMRKNIYSRRKVSIQCYTDIVTENRGYFCRTSPSSSGKWLSRIFMRQ